MYNKGDGHDRVEYFNTYHVSGDNVGKLKFGPGITSLDVNMVPNGYDMIFTVSDDIGSIRFLGANKNDVRYCVDEIVFTDGTVWKWSETAGRRVVRGTASDDVISVTSYPGDKVTVYALGGNDTIYGSRGDEIYVTGPGNDYVREHTSYSGGGNNTFVYNRGDGYDTVEYFHTSHAPGDGIGRLRFGPDIAPQNVNALVSGYNVIFSLSDGSGSITFLGANRNDARYRVDEIEFADGLVRKWSEMAP